MLTARKHEQRVLCASIIDANIEKTAETVAAVNLVERHAPF
jgi:hypothetical protein